MSVCSSYTGRTWSHGRPNLQAQPNHNQQELPTNTGGV